MKKGKEVEQKNDMPLGLGEIIIANKKYYEETSAPGQAYASAKYVSEKKIMEIMASWGMTSAITGWAFRNSQVRTKIAENMVYSSLLSAMSLEYISEEEVSKKPVTAWTDGKRIGMNPYFISALSKEEIKFVLLHEIFHITFNHVSNFKNPYTKKEEDTENVFQQLSKFNGRVKTFIPRHANLFLQLQNIATDAVINDTINQENSPDRNFAAISRVRPCYEKFPLEREQGTEKEREPR